jgi:glycosyltransferase involved in cell wall biosynthesis
MFKVLVIAYYYPPMGLSGVQRTLKFTKYLSKYNWEPTVLTTGKTAYYSHDLSLLEEAEKAKIRVERTDSFEINSLLKKMGTVKMPNEKLRKILSKLSKTFFIPDNKVPWALKAYKKAKQLLSEDNYDLIFVSIPPFSSFRLANKLKREFDIPLIVDYRDLWYGNHFAYYPTPYHRMRHKKLEDIALRGADHVVVVNRNIKEKLLTTFPFLKFDDISIIPHGYDPEDFEELSPTKDENLLKKIKITYSGIFYENVTPKYFLKAFKELTVTNPEIAEHFELHFIGHFRRENEKLIKKLNLHRFVHIHGYMNHSDLLPKIISTDVLWVMLGNGNNMNTVSAGKLYEYFGTKKMILATVPEGASKTSAQEYKSSIITSPDNIIEIKNALIQIYEMHKSNSIPEPDENFVNNHNREYLTKLLTQQFQFHLRDQQ